MEFVKTHVQNNGTCNYDMSDMFVFNNCLFKATDWGLNAIESIYQPSSKLV